MMYEYQCQNTGQIITRVRRIQDRRLPCDCNCGARAKFGIFTAPSGHVQPEAHYICPVTNQQVTSWRQRKNTFAEFDLIDANETDQKSLKKTALKKKEQRDALAKDYLPKDLHKEIKKIGAAEGFVA
jgi:predicted nucleic acid-binding Zn ribbon protein